MGPPLQSVPAFPMNIDYGCLFDALSSTIPASILIVDENLIVLMANRNFLEKSRGTLSAIQGLNLQEVLPALPALASTDVVEIRRGTECVGAV